MNSEQPIARRGVEQLEHSLRGQLVRWEVFGDGGPLLLVTLTALQVGAVPSDPRYDGCTAVRCRTQRDRVDLAGVDLAQVSVDQALQAEPVDLSVGVGDPEVELRQPRLHVGRPGGDVVELLLHPGREREVHEGREVLFEQ